MCGECNWPMNPIPPIIIPIPELYPFPEVPIFNGPKEDKDVSGR